MKNKQHKKHVISFLSVFVILSLVFGGVACSTSVEPPAPVAPQPTPPKPDEPDIPVEELGSVTINVDSALQLKGGATVSVLIPYLGTGNKIETTEKTASIAENASSVTIPNIPVGKDRIITVVPSSNATNNEAKLAGVELRAILDIQKGTNSVTVGFSTTAKANVLKNLLLDDERIGFLSDVEKNAATNLVDTTKNPYLVKVDEISADIKAGNTSKEPSQYVLQTGSIQFSYSAGFATPVALLVSDPISSKTMYSSGTVVIEDVAPGTWEFFVKLGDSTLHSQEVVVVSGETKSITLTVIKSIKPRLEDASGKAIPTIRTADAMTVYLGARAMDGESEKSGVKIYYTTDGTMPTTSSTLYTSSGISVPAVSDTNAESIFTIKAFSTLDDPFYQNSDYAIINLKFTPAAQVARPVIEVTQADVCSPAIIKITCVTAGASVYYTLDGSTPNAGSTRYTASFTLTEYATKTVKAIAIKSGFRDSPVEEEEVSIYESLPNNSEELGKRYPLAGPYSPVDKNGADSGFGWSSQSYKPGSVLQANSTTFAVYSKNATKILLEIYDVASGEHASHDYWMEKSADDFWRAEIKGNLAGKLYAFRAWGPNWTYSSSWTRGNSSVGFVADYDSSGNRFNPNKVLYDPYAKELTHDKSNPEVLLPAGLDSGIYASGGDTAYGTKRRNFDTGRYAPKSVIVDDSTSYGSKPKIAQKDAIIYEAHVRGLTNHSSSSNLSTILGGFSGFENVVNIPANKRGTYAGAALMAPYLKALGINTIELLPVHETDNDGNPDDGPGGNFWGYMTFGYFAPDRRYSSDKSYGGPTREFKEMVKAFHDAGIEVYLDVVYNHSGEGGNWGSEKKENADILSMKGLDNSSWYCICEAGGGFWETTGCGNNLRCDTAMVRNFILDSLTYWIDEMGVDGFRFDLAPVLGRVQSGDSWNFSQSAKTITDIAALGVEKNAEMIAEAWDCQWPGGYQVGQFPNGWGEWNGRFRDSLRKYLGAGNATEQGGITQYINGDYDNFNDQGGAHKTVNFVVAHDGFTLADLCSYEGAGNAQNSTLTWPFGPSDGGNGDYNSLAFGTEQANKRQAARNYIALQMMSRGVPMIVYGDELCRTQNGNNNPYNVDSIATWNNYNMINTSSPHKVSTGGAGTYHNNFGTFGNTANKNGNFMFMKYMLNLRANEPALRQSGYSVGYDFKKENGSDSYNSGDRCIWIRIDGSSTSGGSDYLVFSNMWTDMVNFSVPAPSSGKVWKILVDTANWAETNFNCFDEATQVKYQDSTYGVNPWSVVILKETTEHYVPPTPPTPVVETPVISSSTGNYFETSATVSISCDTSGATIYYTKNGSTPTTSSSVYTSPFTITSTTTVKAVAVKSGYTNSSVATKSFTKGTPPPVSSKSGVMLQGFNWSSAPRGAGYNTENPNPRWYKWYNIMNAQASTIGSTFEYVWFPPPSKTDTASSEGYGPTQLNDLNNCYGTAEQLQSVITAIAPAKAIADVVVNHRAGSTCWGDFTNPSWGVVKGSNYKAICSDDEGFTGDPHMSSVSSSMRGAADTGDPYAAYRDLDHTNATVQQGIVDWMNNVLKPAGFVGWRYDYVKGFGGRYVGQYNQGSSAEFSVGEYWPTAGFNSGNPNAWGNEIKNWISATATGGQKSRAFDFALKGIMNTVFGNNASNVGNNNYGLLANAASLVQSQPADAVTFIDNHDTGSTQAHWYLDPADVGTAYAFILTHPGYPCVAWQHYFTDAQSGGHGEIQYIGGNTVPGTSKTYRQHIDYLINLRKTVGIEYDDSVTVLSSSGSCYAAKITGTNGELVVAIGNGYTPSGTGYAGNAPIYKGTNFKIWQKGESGGGEPDPIPTTTNLNVTTNDWAWNEGAKVFAWCWGGLYGDGAWVECTGTGTNVNISLDSAITGFVLVRCHKDTTTPSWSTTGDVAGSIYNQTADVICTLGETNYTAMFN